MIDYMYACKGSINYINASTCSVYVVAYNMYTEIYVWIIVKHKTKKEQNGKKKEIHNLCRGREMWCFSAAAGNLLVPGGVTARD